MSTQGQPPRMFGESLTNWWGGLRKRTKVAVIIFGIVILLVAVNQTLSSGQGSTADPRQNYSEVTPDGSGAPEFQAGWDEVMRLNRAGQAYSSCNVVLQAVRNQGGVSNTWSALGHQTGGDVRTTYAFFAGTVGACEYIADQ